MLLLALVVPPLTTVDISGRIFHVGSGPGGGSGQGGLRGGGTADQRARAPIQFSADARPGAALVADPQPVLSYTSDNSESVYLRVVNDTVFDRGNWYYCAPPTATRALGGGGAIPFDADPGDGALGTLDRRVRVRIVLDAAAAAAQSDALFPGEPQSVLSGGTVPAGTAASCTHPTGASSTSGLLTVDRVPLRAGIVSLDTVGLMPTATEDQLRSAGTDDPAWVRQFTELPTGAPADTAQKLEITNLARDWTAGLTTRYDIATAIETHLRSQEFTYTLSPPQPHDGTWPITLVPLHHPPGLLPVLRLLDGDDAPRPRHPRPGRRRIRGRDRGRQQWPVAHRHPPGEHHRRPQLGRGLLPPLRLDPLRADPAERGRGQLRDLPAGRGAGQRPCRPARSTTPMRPRSRRRAPGPSPTRPPARCTPPRAAPRAAWWRSSSCSCSPARCSSSPGAGSPRAHSAPALRQRMGVLGVAFGVRRRASDTDAGFARRLAHAFPADTTTLLHRDGSAAVGPRPVRASATEALALIADLSGKEHYSLEGLLPAEEVRRRRAWLRVCRVSPLLLWRRLLAATVRA